MGQIKELLQVSAQGRQECQVFPKGYTQEGTSLIRSWSQRTPSLQELGDWLVSWSRRRPGVGFPLTAGSLGEVEPAAEAPGRGRL